MRYQEGLHGALITDQELTTTKSGNPSIVLTIQILTRLVETNDPGTNEPVQVWENVELSEKRKVWLVLTDNSIDWTVDRLKVLGFQGLPSQIKDKEAPGTTVSATELVFEMRLGGNDGTLEGWNVPTKPRSSSNAEPTTEMQDLELDAKFGDAFRAGLAKTDAKEQVQQITAASADVPF